MLRCQTPTCRQADSRQLVLNAFTSCSSLLVLIDCQIDKPVVILRNAVFRWACELREIEKRQSATGAVIFYSSAAPNPQNRS